MKKRYLQLFALTVVLGLVAAACGGGTSDNNKTTTPASPGNELKGGTYRTAIEALSNTDGWDPVGEYYAGPFGLFSQMLARTLVNTNHVAGPDGNVLYPDLAQDMPEVSTDGLTYTFHLKPGVQFSPPVSRDVTSKDVEYAFERLDTASLLAEYASYYDGVIEGMNGAVKKPGPISGIETPDDTTIIFHLTAPTGDFLYRLAMPAAAPVPPEVGKCFTHAADYGKDYISSGPYMYKGTDKIDISSCDTIKPVEGFDLDKGVVIVRNPNYDAATDTTDMRENNIDGLQVVVNTNTDDIFNKVQAGDIDGTWASIPPATVVQQYTTNPDLKGLYHVDSADRTQYIWMNLITPPFDDIHVRKAVSLATNKAALIKAGGGPSYGTVATHIMPKTVLPQMPADYNPYPSTGDAGDIPAALAEMKQSHYKTDASGKCIDAACSGVLLVNRNYPPYSAFTPIFQASMAPLGLTFRVRELDPSAMSALIQVVSNQVPIGLGSGWGKDYADPVTFAYPLFDSDFIICDAAQNYSNVGMTAAKAKECGVSLPAAGPPPSVDDIVAKCEPLTGDARAQCWVGFDQTVMEDIVAWVPWSDRNNPTVVGTSLVKWEYDQFSGYISWSHIAVDNGIDPNTLSI